MFVLMGTFILIWHPEIQEYKILKNYSLQRITFAFDFLVKPNYVMEESKQATLVTLEELKGRTVYTIIPTNPVLKSSQIFMINSYPEDKYLQTFNFFFLDGKERLKINQTC